MRVINLASGSKGNATLIETSNISILVDCGLGLKEIEKRLNIVGCDITKIKAILVSHLHSDHTNGVVPFSNKYNVPVYARSINYDNIKLSYLSNRAFNNALLGIKPSLRIVMDDEKFTLKDLEIETFEVSHDAINTVGFTFTNSGRKVGLVTDLGVFEATALNFLAGSDLVLIESNHDEAMLKAGKYPLVLKNRILSNKGHLSNMQCAEAIWELNKRGTSFFMLMHLSEENNEPNLAVSTVYNYLNTKNACVDKISVFVSNQFVVSKNFILKEKVENI